MQAYLRAQRSWLTVERPPGYALEVNPGELVWGNVKGAEPANLCADNLGEVKRELRAGLRRVPYIRPKSLHVFERARRRRHESDIGHQQFLVGRLGDAQLLA